MHKFIIMGPQGSGKGTQAKILAQSLSIAHISTGELFRWHMAHGTWLADRIRDNMDSGHLVSDEVVEEVLMDRLSRSDIARGYILDGFPRTPAQGKFFLDHYQVDAVLVLDVSHDLVMKRILGRRLCSQCGKDFNIHFSPPKVADICDQCGGGLEARSDDTPEAICRRLDTYRSKTEPVIDMFRRRSLVIDIDAGGSSSQVNETILKALKTHGVV